MRTELPGPEHFNAFERSSECLILKRVWNERQEVWDELGQQAEALKHAMVEARQTVERCAGQSGSRAGVEQAMAEQCHQDYKAWMKVGFAFRTRQEERAELAGGMRLLRLRLASTCANTEVARNIPAAFQ